MAQPALRKDLYVRFGYGNGGALTLGLLLGLEIGGLPTDYLAIGGGLFGAISWPWPIAGEDAGLKPAATKQRMIGGGVGSVGGWSGKVKSAGRDVGGTGACLPNFVVNFPRLTGYLSGACCEVRLCFVLRIWRDDYG